MRSEAGARGRGARRSAVSRLRELRLARNLAQAELAREAGISAAYLNLIEHGRRPLRLELRDRLAQALRVEPEMLEARHEDLLVTALAAAAAAHPPGPLEPAVIAPEAERLSDLVARYPGWAALLGRLARGIEQRDARLAVLAERFTDDPTLVATLHEILSAITSLRATAQILAAEEAIEPEWLDRFHGNIDMDSARLVTLTRSLVDHLDSFAEDRRPLGPRDEIEAWDRAARPDPRALDPPLSDAADELRAALLASEARDAEALPDHVLRAALGAGTADAALQNALREADLVALADRLGVGLALVLRRVAQLDPAVGVVECDLGGAVLRRRVPAELMQSTGHDACPLLPVFSAFLRPAQALRRTIETVESAVFDTLSVAEIRQPEGAEGPILGRAVMLVWPGSDEAAGRGIAIGPSCRICPRGTCPARREPSILGGIV